MKLITRDTDYAIRALCFIANRPKEIVSVDDLVKNLKMPRPFLRKILQALNRDGILHSYKGSGGGFKIAVPAGRISIVDLIEIFQGALRINECFFKKRRCPNMNICKLRKKIGGIEKNVLAELKSITIADLLL